MIRSRNVEEFIVDLSVPGTQSAAANKATFLVPFACSLKAIYAKLGTAGITGTQTVDINKNGTTIWDSTPKLSFATTVAAAGYDAFATDPTTFAKGDIIGVDVDAVHSGTAAKDLNLLLVLKRGGNNVGATQTDTIGADAE